MKKLFGPTGIFFPLPVALVACGTMEKPNIITIAWISMLDESPPTLGFSIRKERHSFELIQRYKEFSVNIPSSKYFKEVDLCGIYSGKNIDKFKETGLTPVRASKISAPIIKECPLNIECSLAKSVEINNRILFVAGILETHIDNDMIVDEKAMKLDIKKASPLIYCSRIREYWSIGEKLGNAFSAGKKHP